MSLPEPRHAEPINIGHVLARTWPVLWRAGPVIWPTAILLGWAPNLIQVFVMRALQPQGDGPWWMYATINTVGWLAFPLADVMVVIAALPALAGRRIGLGQALATGLAVYPVALGLDFLQNLITLGETWLMRDTAVEMVRTGAFALELIYGMASAAILLPSLAIAAQERTGFRASLARTVALTRGNRWRIAAIGALFLFLQMVVGRVAQGVIVALVGPEAGLWLNGVPSVLIFAYSSSLQAVLYWELARLTDGVAPEDLDRVFG